MTRVGFQAYLPGDDRRSWGWTLLAGGALAAALVRAGPLQRVHRKIHTSLKEIIMRARQYSACCVAVARQRLRRRAAALSGDGLRRRRGGHPAQGRLVQQGPGRLSTSCAQHVSIPPKKGRGDHRLAARRAPVRPRPHSRCAINIPDSQFDKLVDKLPARQGHPAAVLLRRAGVHAEPQLGLQGREARLHQHQGLPSPVRPTGRPRAAPMSVSAAYLKKLMPRTRRPTS
jgi:hypothetical protein